MKVIWKRRIDRWEYVRTLPEYIALERRLRHLGYIRHLIVGSITSIGSVAVSCMMSHGALAPTIFLTACKASVAAAFVSYWVGAIQTPPEK